MVRNIQIGYLYNKNVILSTLCLNLMDMPNRHKFKIEISDTALTWTFHVCEMLIIIRQQKAAIEKG
jgi:hypothetical protein